MARDRVGRRDARAAAQRSATTPSSSSSLLRAVPDALRRPYLVVAQIHAIGNLSLVIILASGLAVGFVLALQMYYALVTYGAAESLGPDRQPVAGARARAGRHGAALRRAAPGRR